MPTTLGGEEFQVLGWVPLLASNKHVYYFHFAKLFTKIFVAELIMEPFPSKAGFKFV